MAEKTYRLSLAERDQHYKLVKEAMQERNLDALLIWGGVGGDFNGMANVHYLSQFGGNGEEGFLIFPLEGEPYLINGHASAYQNKCWQDYGCWIEDIHGREDGSYVKAVISGLKQLKLTGGRLGIPGLVEEDGNMFPSAMFTVLDAELSGAELTDASGLIENIRAVKSPEELALIVRSTEIAEATVDKLFEVARPGVAEHEIVADLFHTMVSLGSDLPMLFLWDCGKVLSGGGRLGWTKHRILEPGDILFMEFSPKVHGYCCHLNQTSVLGDWPEGLENAYEVWQRSYDAGYKAVKPGLGVEELRNILREPVEAAGMTFRIGFHGIGYGNEGFGLPEEPGGPVKFREGMCIAFEPIATIANGTGVRLGDTVVVTKDGLRRLGREPIIKIIR
jgi:Xaa-Pro aminopeptidase